MCFYCGKEIEGTPYIIGIDIPYINLTFHEDCFRKINNGREEEYLQKNKERIFKLAKEKR